MSACDGHFRNTLHFDPHDNFLCQTKGSKLVLLWEPSQADNLYYADRLDVQAKFSARRGEYDRRETPLSRIQGATYGKPIVLDGADMRAPSGLDGEAVDWDAHAAGWALANPFPHPEFRVTTVCPVRQKSTRT